MKLKVLLADSDTGSRSLLRDALTQWGYEVIEASDRASAWAALKVENAPPLAILDVGAGGIQICEQVRKRPNATYPYVVLLAERGQKEEIAQGIKAGADEFLTRPVDPVELEVRVRGGATVLGLREGLERTRREVDYQVHHDPLTGVWNRVAIVDALWRELTRGLRQASPVGILLVALEGLKKLNESQSYAAGDDALRETARRLSSMVRPYDIMGRYGGDVFLIIAPGCDEQDAVAQARRLQAGINTQPIEVSRGFGLGREREHRVLTSLSIGVAGATGASQPELLLRAAEAALRRARSGGGNRVESATLFIAATAAQAA